MNRENKIERLKDELHASDYIAIKHSEGWISDEEYSYVKAQRQSIREEINNIEVMNDEQFYEAYPDEEEISEERFAELFGDELIIEE